jgi:hypothetical protein
MLNIQCRKQKAKLSRETLSGLKPAINCAAFCLKQSFFFFQSQCFASFSISCDTRGDVYKAGSGLKKEIESCITTRGGKKQ